LEAFSSFALLLARFLKYKTVGIATPIAGKRAMQSTDDSDDVDEDNW